MMKCMALSYDGSVRNLHPVFRTLPDPVASAAPPVFRRINMPFVEPGSPNPNIGAVSTLRNRLRATLVARAGRDETLDSSHFLAIVLQHPHYRPETASLSSLEANVVA
jgi:hypothetical protein